MTVDPLEVLNLLAFAGIASLTVPVIPLVVHVTEKVHACTRTYADGTRMSTREKDLLDLVLIAELSPFDARALRTALEETFSWRGTHPLPTRVPLPPPSWGPGYRKLALAVGANPDVLQGQASVAAFLDPVLATASFEGQWDNSLQRWFVPAEERPAATT